MLKLATKRAAFAVLAALALALGTLATGCNKHGPQVTWPDVVQCGEEAAEDLAPIVSRILFANGGNLDPQLDDAARDELGELALKHSPSLISCVVDLLVNKRWNRQGSTPHPERMKAMQRGREFLRCPSGDEDACKPIEVQTAPGDDSQARFDWDMVYRAETASQGAWL